MRTLAPRAIRSVWLCLFVFCSFPPFVSGAEFAVPALTAPVVDRAGLLSPQAERALGGALREFVDQGGSQISVLTVETLGGVPIEQASIRVTDQWKLGQAKADRGVLLMVARNERKVRIEVGQGNEGTLTDAVSKRIISETITPLFRTGRYDSGFIAGVAQIARATDPSIDFTALLGGTLPRAEPRTGPPFGILLLILFVFVLMVSRAGRGGPGGRLRRRGIYYAPPILFGGFGGGRGGGFGGWSGGGGGFSGGGASGDW